MQEPTRCARLKSPFRIVQLPQGEACQGCAEKIEILPDGSIRDILYWPELNSAEKLWKTRGGNPILFPFAGRSFVKGEIYRWQSPTGECLPMPMHGLARQGCFKTSRIDPHGFSAIFQPDDEARLCYPFDYEFSVSYRFSSLSLACELTLKNLGSTPIPWSAGHHFYFNLPWSEGLTRRDYKIHLPAQKPLRQDMKNGQLSSIANFKATESLGNPELIDCIHTALQKNVVTFGSDKGPGEITMEVGMDKVPPPEMAVLTWSESETAPYYCVEPWMGPPNAPENRVGLHWVPPGKTQSFLVEIKVQ